MIQTKVIEKFIETCDKKLQQHKMMITIIKDVSGSSKTLAKSFDKLTKKVEKDSTLYEFCDAGEQLNGRTSNSVKDFAKVFEQNYKEQAAFLKQCRKPFEKQMKVYGKLAAKAEKDQKALNRAEATVYEKNAAVLRNKSEKTEANLTIAQQKLTEAKKLFESSANDNEHEIGTTQQVVNETAKVLTQVYEKLTQFEKLFYEKTANLQEARIYFERLSKVHERVGPVDPKQATEQFTESINLKSALEKPVFKLLPADPVRQAAEKQTDQPAEKAPEQANKQSPRLQGAEEKVPESKNAEDASNVFQKADGDLQKAKQPEEKKAE